MMYSVPELYGQRDYMVPVYRDDTAECINGCLARRYPCDPHVFELCIEYMSENGFTQPKTPEEALELYLWFRQMINTDAQHIIV